MTTKSPRGLTLIELMVTVAIMSLLLVAALTVFVAMTETQRLNERIGEASANKLMGAAMIQFDVQNAGYRLPVPAYAIRHYNNADGALSLPSVPAAITTGDNCPGPGSGVVPGTDVLEVTQGFGAVGPGRLGVVTAAVGTTADIVLGGVEPFIPDEYVPASIGTLLVFARGPLGPPAPDDGAFCQGRVTAIGRLDAVGNCVAVGGTGNGCLTVQLVDRNLANAPNAAFYPSCPAGGMKVFRVASRVRYMVCGTPAATPVDLGLYRQEANGGVWQAPTLIQTGIEDLQVSARYLNRGGIVTATGSGLDCIGTGNGRLCYCDDDPVAPSCTVPAAQRDGALAALTPNSMIALIRGVRVRLTATGDRGASSNPGAKSFVRPGAFDRAAMLPANADNFVRVVDTLSFSGSNLLVVP